MIREVSIKGKEYSVLAASKIEEFELPGEYCAIPWIRVRCSLTSPKEIIECPIHAVDYIKRSE